MPAPRTPGFNLRVLLLTLFLSSGAASGQSADTPILDEERIKQENIYHGQGEQRPEGYVIDRSLRAYGRILSEAFNRALSALGPGDRWLDIGAGMGEALLDYYADRYDAAASASHECRGGKARAIAISIEDRRTSRWHETAASLAPQQIEYHFGKRMSEYSMAELGRFKVITDVIGGFSYTERLSAFMEKVLDLLTINGSFFTVLQDVQSEAGSNPPFYEGASYLTVINNSTGVDMQICSWLKSISCVAVSCSLKAGWRPPVEAYHVRKVCNNVVVPELTMIHFEAGTPPERGFWLANPRRTPGQRTEAAR